MNLLKRILTILTSIFLLLVLVLAIYASNPYQPLADMDEAIEALDTDAIATNEGINYISYTVDNPIKNIVFIPGGLVNPHSYDYLAVQLARSGYNVTIFKPFFDLAILTPNLASKYLSDELDNIIIGHSLGGVVASMIAAKEESISTVILMGSYPIQDISNKHTLIITAEFDIAMDQEAFDQSLQNVNSDTEVVDISGGNHAQFGWYGPQKGDGEATISTLQQQSIILGAILDFINE